MRTPEPKINDYDICYDYIVRCRYYLEDHWTLNEEDLERKITDAEIDLMEMEIQMIADAKEYDALLNGNTFRSSKRASRRKQNKKNKERDRIHGRRHGGAHGGVDFRYVDCNPFCNKHQYVDAMFATNGKHRHNANKRASAMDAREQDFLTN